MNYQKIYDDICKRGQERELPKEVYTEKHHIVPKCMEGTNEKSNLTVLTAREHFLVHYILTRIYPNNSKIWSACFKMCSVGKGQQRFIPDSKLYEFIKTGWNKINRGENHHAYGKTFSDDHKRKIGAAQKGKFVPPEVGQKLSNALRGRKLAPAHKENIILAMKSRDNPNARKCQIDGVIYISVSQAMRDLDLSIKILKKRLESDLEEWSKWVYLEDSKVKQVTREKLSKLKSEFRHSEESKANMGQRGELNHFYGKTHTEESIYKMILNKPDRKPCNINGIIYISIADATRKLNMSERQISYRLNSPDDKWKDWIFINKTEENNL